jgi:methanogenic corrinoid protein MtbC1
MIEVIKNEYLKYLLNGQKNECLKIVNNLLDQGIDIKQLYTNLLQYSLYEVGKLWEYNKISVAKEHLATSITEFIMNTIYPRIFLAEHTGKKAIVACLPNEFHQVGAKMVADIFELNAWDGYFLGSNVPTNDLIKMIQDINPDLVGISMSIYFNISELVYIVNEINSQFPNQKIVVGGQGFNQGGKDFMSTFPNVTYISDIYNLEKYIKKIGYD